MSDYPALSEMDVSGYNEISRYSVFQDRKDRDILRIYYKRKKGSMLPRRKVFRFGRSAKMVNDSSAPGGTVEVFEISPFLQRVMGELDSIIGDSHNKKDKVKILLKRIEQLENETRYVAAEMKAILKEMQE